MSKLIDLVGKRFGRLIVVQFVNKNKFRKFRWLCQCDCGNNVIVQGDNLKNSHTRSCGCFQKEKTSINRTKHGHKKKGRASKTYMIWVAMIQRCINPNNLAYHYYGGRGIKVCNCWKNSFENFLEDMGECLSGHSIDRINNDGNYCKSNCKWATRKQQARNRINNHLETYNKKVQCIAEWAEEYDISPTTLWSRLYKYGWSMSKALITPVRKVRR